MAELPVHPSADALLTGSTRPEDGIAAELVARVGLTDFGPLERSVLTAASSLEAERLGDVVVRPEHVVLGRVRVAEDRGERPSGVPALDVVRAELQALMADRAYAEYEALRPVPRPDAVRRPRVVLLAGVPGTGKSTVAEALAWRLTAPVFSVDWQLGALLPFGALRADNTEHLAELTLTASVARQLQLGLDVIVDATGHRRETRRRWRSVTERLGGVFVGVECVCSDEDEQRRRVEGRVRGIPGWPATVTWEHVLRMKARWESWDEPHLVVDSATEPPEVGVRRVHDHCLLGQ
ncbi:AAA family ATPase [Actinosynnema sp. NPDC051121]